MAPAKLELARCYGPQASITDGSCVDQGLVYKRSLDQGRTWSAAIELAAPNYAHFYSYLTTSPFNENEVAELLDGSLRLEACMYYPYATWS